MAERVVDLLEPVEVDDGDRGRLSRCRTARHRLLGALVEQRPVGELGERVVLGQELVLLDLVAQAPADRHRDREQHAVQERKTDEEVAVQVVETRGDVAAMGA